MDEEISKSLPLWARVFPRERPNGGTPVSLCNSAWNRLVQRTCAPGVQR